MNALNRTVSAQESAGTGAHPRNAVRVQSRVEAVGIVIPAHNHAGTIAACVQSIYAAFGHAGWPFSLWIVVVADACTDDTVKIARECTGSFGNVLEVAAHSLQLDHRLGANAVFDHFREKARHAILLAGVSPETTVNSSWIGHILRTPASV